MAIRSSQLARPLYATGVRRFLGGAATMIGLLATTMPAMAEVCKEGQCTMLPEQNDDEVPVPTTGGISLMQSGRSVMPAIETQVRGIKFDDSFVDDFASMEDEFDDGSVQASSSLHASKTPSTIQSWHSVSALTHARDPFLYIETLLVIAAIAVAAKGVKWVSSFSCKATPKAVEPTSEAASGATSRAETGDNAETAPIFTLGGSKNFAALEQAVRAGDEAKCLELLKEGGRRAVHQEDPCGCTALHVAAHCGSAAMARLLLNHGANVDACEAWEETPLHIAARSGSVEVSELLLDRGANIDAINAHGWTPLLSAGHAKQEAACELLLSRGAGAGGVSDTELPPLVNALLIRRMFIGAKPHAAAAEAFSDGSEQADETMGWDEDFEQ